MNFPFTIEVNELTNLGPDRAVEFFRRLLWAEAGHVGVGLNLMSVPQCINVGDGGIDAYIENAAPTRDELIPTGTSGFQIKASDLPPQACKNELHVDGKCTNPLKPELKRILDVNGCYILVLFADISSPQIVRRINSIKEELRRLGHNNPVRLYTADKLVGYAERFLSLVTWLKPEYADCLSYSVWADQADISSPRDFILDQNRSKFIADIQEQLRNTEKQCPIIRVIGLSGIGKTRLVFESLAPDYLKNRAIYVKAERFLSSRLYNILQNDNNKLAFIVVDECDIQRHEEVVRAFSNRGSRLAIITLSFDFERTSAPTLLYKLEKLKDEKIEEIIRSEAPQLQANVVRRIAEFADGFPRIATLLVESYLSRPASGEDLLVIKDDALMNRLIAGRADMSCGWSRQTKKVLKGLSLFSKIGYEDVLEKESRWLAAYFDVDWNDFKNIVFEQRNRGIIQGQHYIYVTPFMLRIYLSREWWDSIGFNVQSFETFVDLIPDDFKADLLERFFEHIPYIAGTAKGEEFANRLLGPDGSFMESKFLRTQFGANFFLKLSEAVPEAALKCLKSTLGTWNIESLKEFSTGRREIVWALERIVMWRECFIEAARLLLALAEAETENFSNNASGIFVGLFSPGGGVVAPTEASPEERFPILREALESDSKERRILGLQACRSALESTHFMRSSGPEKQGLRKEPELWQPKTWGELFEAYRRVWQYLRSRLHTMEKDEREIAINIVVNASRGLVRMSNLSDMVIETLEEFLQKEYISGEALIEEISRILHYDTKNLHSDAVIRLVKLRDELTGTGYSAMMKRYVKMELLEDKFDEKGEYVDSALPKIEELAMQSLSDPDKLKNEFNWLFTDEANRGREFGEALGRLDKNFSLLPLLQDEFIKVSLDVRGGAFLGGYFHAMKQLDTERWETVLDDYARHGKLAPWVPALTRSSGLTDRAALRMLSLAKEERIKANDFCFIHVKHLTEKIFHKWLRFLLGHPDRQAIYVAISLFFWYYIYRDVKAEVSNPVFPQDLTFKLLTHKHLFDRNEEKGHRRTITNEWTLIGVKFARTYPEKSIEMARVILQHFGEDGTILEGYFSQTQEVIDEIAKTYSKEVWSIVKDYLGPPLDDRSFHLRSWLRRRESFGRNEKPPGLTFFPKELIFQWVDEDIEKRAWLLATFVHKDLSKEEKSYCTGRDLLVRYGNRVDVKRNFTANYYSEAFSGPGSVHYQRVREKLLEYKSAEDNSNVIQWIDEYIAMIEQNIIRERIDEERQGF